MLIGIGGKFRSGKDMAAAVIGQYARSQDHYVIKKAFADPVRKVLEAITGVKRKIDPSSWVSFNEPVWIFTPEQKNIYFENWDMTLGRMHQVVGTDILRNNLGEDVWINATLKNYDAILDEIWIISDIRFINEFKKIKELGGITIKIERKDFEDEDSGRIRYHQSEIELDEIKNFDYIIHNDSDLDSFKLKVLDIAKKIII